MAELTDDQIDRQDAVQDAIYGLLVDLAFNKHGIMPEMEFYPFIDEDDDEGDDEDIA